MTRYVFITGGVVSSLGKGLASAALGALLQARGFKVRLRKLDPYLNVDPGTMSPYQHGEVFVTDDGAETDLDLGHYERFTGRARTRDDNITTGPHLSRHHHQGAARRLSRRDDPGHPARHRTPSRSSCVDGNEGVDFVLVEIGGTVGDIEGLPFFEAIRQLGNELDARPGDLRPPDAAALHPLGRRAEDQADPALGRGAALDRHPARHPALPLRPADPGRRAQQARAVLQRARERRHRGARRLLDLRRAALLPRRGARPEVLAAFGIEAAAPPALERWRTISSRREEPGGRRHHRHRRQVHGAQGRLQIADRGARARRHRQPRQGQPRLDRERDLRARGSGALPRGRPRHPGARRLRPARRRGQDPGGALSRASARSRISASASACRWR